MSSVASTVVCDNQWMTIIMTICFVVTLVVTWLCAIYLTHNLWYQQKICSTWSDGTNGHKKVKLICVATEIQCGLSQIVLAILIYFLYKKCIEVSANTVDSDEITVQTTGAIFLGMFMYTFSLTCVNIVFASRVAVAFYDTIWQLSKKQIIFLKLVFITQFCCNLASPALYFFFNSTVSLFFMALSLVK